MSDPKVLVFGDDGSSGADEAWTWVCAQAWGGWRAEVLTAVMPPVGPPPDPADAAPHPWEPPALRQAGDSGLVEVAHLRADADPRYVLEHQEHAALLVVGPVGKGFLKSLHLGSTTEHVLTNASSPVAVARGTEPVRRVLVAVDGSDHAQAAVEAYATMPWADQVEAVTVVTIPEGSDHHVGALDRAVAVLTASTVETRELERGDSVWETIVGAAEDDGAHLVVAGTHGVGAVKQVVLGSTATALASHAACPVLFARAAGS